jgi:catechol 2,3-dioxygenase-like lactoylglutathione lyase family enzyme
MTCMLRTIDHITLRSGDLERTQTFYVDLLGLCVGPRPSFSVPGLWLYVGERAVVHVLEAPVPQGEGTVDHVAFEACGRATISAQLRDAGVAFELRALPDGSALQMFLRDPDGARIELVFKDQEDR